MGRALGASAIPIHLFSFFEKIRVFMKMGLGLIICTDSTLACDSLSCHIALLGGDGLAEPCWTLACLWALWGLR